MRASDEIDDLCRISTPSDQRETAGDGDWRSIDAGRHSGVSCVSRRCDVVGVSVRGPNLGENVR